MVEETDSVQGRTARARAGGARRLRSLLASLVGVLALTLLCAPVSAAQAQTLSTGPASNVAITSATLNGTASGLPAGSYCSFAYEDDTSASPVQLVDQVPAVPCGVSQVNYSIQLPVDDLIAGNRYSYFAVACATPLTPGSGGTEFCNTSSGVSAIDTCQPNCPTFTTSEPTATTDAQTNVLGSSATLNGTLGIQDLSADPSAVSYYFQYTTDSSFGVYAQTTETQLQPGVGSTVPVSANLTGLIPGTTYYYRVVVALSEELTGGAGTYLGYGSIMSFTTGGRVLTDAATQLASSSATLNGEVAAGNDPLAYHFVYSTSDTTVAGVLQGTSVGSGTVSPGQDLLVSANATGLSSGTSYYVQLVATDQTTNATLTGAIITFTTAGGSCPSGATQQTDTQIPGTGFVVSGCFATTTGPPSSAAPWVGYGSITINGLPFGGPSSRKAIFTASHLTLAQGYSLTLGSTPVSVAGSAGLSFSYTNTTACATAGASGCDSTLDIAPDPTAAFFGFPLIGTITITAHASSDNGNPGGADVSLAALGVPALFGGVTASGSATVSEDGTLSAISAQLGDSQLGPFSLPEIAFSYDGPTNTWSANVDLNLPLSPVGIGATVAITNGQLSELSADYSGQGIPIGETGLELNAINFEATFNPFSLGGGVGVGFGPQVHGTDLFEGNVNLLVAYDSPQTLNGLPGIPNGYTLPNVPVTIQLSGNLQLLGFITLAQAQTSLYVLSSGPPLITASVQIGQPLTISCGKYGLGFDNQFTIAGDALGTDFNLVGTGQAQVDLCSYQPTVSAEAAISSTGFYVCASIKYVGILGYGIDWSQFSSVPTDPSTLLKGLQIDSSGTCDASPYLTNIPLPPGVVQAAAAGHAFRLAALRLKPRLPFEVLRFRGRGAPPLIAVSGPRGLHFALAPGHNALLSRRGYMEIADPGNDTTYVEIDHPVAGRYALGMAVGSAPVVHVSASAGLPAPRVRGRLLGRGLERELRWFARPRPGQRLVFREVGADGDRLLLATRRDHGILRYRLRLGARGRRELIVQVFDGGKLQTVIPLARYFGPTYRRPLTPLRTEALRRRGRVYITWRQPGQRPARWLVLVFERDGARVLHRTFRPLVVLSGAAARGALRATVTAQNFLGQHSPTVGVRVRLFKPARKKPKKRRR
jgi:hypothetical protein